MNWYEVKNSNTIDSPALLVCKDHVQQNITHAITMVEDVKLSFAAESPSFQGDVSETYCKKAFAVIEVLTEQQLIFFIRFHTAASRLRRTSPGNIWVCCL
ncbi:hypothetical protein IQ13_0239 [Lacibacter cauensis]|uniref:Uncharacterized protein n=1 Tax=Lacibacter cauensis TaxID=510947 RepID=A0A562SVN8_9BACT|nr:hypothetical protein [Lacibacter cauensis]TWI85084.1 hypothetical protein IQ13_0239 [Lacibacter cauensis]